MISNEGWGGAGDRRVPAGYRWVRTLRRGPWGVVQLAHDERLDRPVAVELLVPALAGAPNQRARIAHETALAASLGHPHILPVQAMGELDGSAFLVTPFVDGPDLGARLATGPLSGPATLHILAAVADGLDTAHRAGLVHRGVGPGTVLLGPPFDLPLVRGFGVAPGAGVACAGAVPGDLAPEQLSGAPIGPRTDVYALGGLLYRCLTGRAPFAGAAIGAPPPRVSDHRPDLPRGIDAVVARAMATDPARRFTGCRALVEAAEAALVGRRPRSRRRPALVALGVVLALGAAAVLAVPPIVAAFRPAADELARVPAALRADCTYGAAADGLPDATRVLRCRDGAGGDATISLFGSGPAAEAGYRGLATATPTVRSGVGDCADQPGWEHRYPAVGTARGRVFCDRDGTGARTAWLDRPARSVTVAVRSDGNALELYRSWAGWVEQPRFPTAADQELLAVLPASGCRPATAGGLENLDGLTAAVTCPPRGAGASSLIYYRFADAESLRRAYAADVAAAGSPPDQFCADRATPEIVTGNAAFSVGPVPVGQVLCATSGSGTPAITWTADPLFVMGRVTGVDRTALVDWWIGNGGPMTVAVVAAINKQASPPFPTPQEAALLARIPKAMHPTCFRPSPTSITDFAAEAALSAVECGPVDGGPARVYYFQYPDGAAADATITREITGPDCTTSPPGFDGIARYARPDGSTGILLCFQGEYEYGVGWTDEQAGIVGAAFDTDMADLLAWWRDDADPG